MKLFATNNNLKIVRDKADLKIKYMKEVMESAQYNSLDFLSCV